MKKIIYLHFLMILIVAFNACSKQELKKPVQVNFAFDLNKSFDQNSALKFVSGTIALSDFNVSGNREEGEDIVFTRSFDSNLEIDVNGSGEVSELDYDLPQGIYNSLFISFSIPSGSNQNVLTLSGTYKPTSGPAVGVDFELNSGQVFNILGEDIQGADNIVLEEGNAKKVTIELDPIYWFEIVPVSLLDNADITTGGGQPTMLINETNNIDIYTLVLDRIDESNRVIFK